MDHSIPLWVWGVLVFLCLGTVAGRWPAPAFAGVGRRELFVERDPRRMCVRELRQLPGVGHKLALELARTRDAHRADAHGTGQPLHWEDVPGIGEVRARGIRAWCRAHGLEPDPLCAGECSSAGLGYPLGVENARRLERLWFPLRLCVVGLLAACGDATRSGSVAPSPTGTTAPEPTAAAPAGAPRARSLALQGGALHALEAGPVDGALVLLLHGARYSAQTWAELGTLERLAHEGYHALALDWPGFGATPSWGAEADASTLLESLCDELGAQRVVLVAPSMSGHFAFEFLGSDPTRVAALVAIAPAGAEAFTPESWNTPTLLLWGERDEVVPLAQGRALAGRLAGARLEVLAGASHPCYLDQPERFHALLLEFLAAAAPTAGNPGR